MKEASVLNVLMYLFHYHMQDSCKLDAQEDTLLDSLQDMGFKKITIIQAFGWLANLNMIDPSAIEFFSAESIRVYSKEECVLLDESCRGFLMSLEQQGILNPTTREMVIHQTIELADEGIDIEIVKWVALMVLYNQPEEKESLANMELLVLHDDAEGVH